MLNLERELKTKKFTGTIKLRSFQSQFKSNIFLSNNFKSEGLMYNPINMKIEDEKRLYERDLREKNKR
jgi:hypothetical protein